MKENNRLSIWRHKKTGNIYVVIYDEAIECTNGRENIAHSSNPQCSHLALAVT